MKSGFIFDTGKCVGCRACSAACRLRNNFTSQTRVIHDWNDELLPGIPVFHISLACNHCTEADCMKGCPSGAYRREGTAVVIEPDRCIGCRYCVWNCPYDAPCYTDRGVVEKCHLCYEDLRSGDNPACTNACPTGALSYGVLPEAMTPVPGWFPSGMKPSVDIRGITEAQSPEVFTGYVFTNNPVASYAKPRSPEWSLVAFTFIAMVFASLVSSSMFTGNILQNWYVVALIVTAGVLSLFHLGRPASAWKAVLNPVSSPLAREIIFFGIFSALALASSLTRAPILNAAASITGIFLMFSIDLVYMMPERKRSVKSGQVFPGFLLLTAYFSGSMLPFTLIAAVKIISAFRKMAGKNKTEEDMFLLFVRVAFLTIAWSGLITGVAMAGPVITALILVGEFADRTLFYRDFSPENMKNNMTEYFKRIKNEKEGS
jgi:Fe-S-cluster-containing dehydrogenase component/DMSO reductase anchor subunit